MLLLEFLEPAGVTQYRLAQATGISISRINDVVKGRRSITPDMAIRLGAAFKVGPEIWLNLQHRYDMRRAREKRGAEYDAIKPLPELETVT